MLLSGADASVPSFVCLLECRCGSRARQLPFPCPARGEDLSARIGGARNYACPFRVGFLLVNWRS